MTSRIQYNNPRASGAFGLPYHYEMVSDVKRVGAFKEALGLACQDRIVLESGCGSGILSLLAARAGARQVVTVEVDPVVADIGETNIRKSGYQNIILLRKDILSLSLDEIGGQRPDIVIAENLSTWCVTEPQMQIISYLRRHIADEHTIFIPCTVLNYAQLVHSPYSFENLVEIRTYYFQFSGVPDPLIMSRRICCSEFQFGKMSSSHCSVVRDFVCTIPGIVNGVRFTSEAVIYGNIVFRGSDSLFPPVIFPLPGSLHVHRGEHVRLNLVYECGAGWEAFECSADRERL